MANVMYFCINEFHWTPSQFFAMNEKEKAIMIACTQIRLTSEKRKQAEIDAARKG